MFGIYVRIRKYAKSLSDQVQAQYQKNQKREAGFIFNKRAYQYFIHPYNYTWKNERIIEIPIIKKVLEENKGQDILEVGNVMSHYIQINHDVLDKYEISKGVINQDVVNFKNKKNYDLIISVSTLEHVGWDEEKKDFKKVLKAVTNLKKCLKRGGQIIITHPLGYNRYMDDFLKNGELGLNKIFLMIRTSESNTWKQIPWKKSLEIRYHYPFAYANGVVIGVIDKK